MKGPYDDIIGLPHHTSTSRQRMPRSARAAQFSPFAALSGYEEAIEETARFTEERPHLSEDGRAMLDSRLSSISQSGNPACITFFAKDMRKEGGTYQTIRDTILRIDSEKRLILLSSGREIAFDDIMEITEEGAD